MPPGELRNLYAACDVLVVPSIATPTFREPWGLVVNEAMNRGLPVIASDAVGAAAGGLVRDGRNGLVVPAGDSDALAGAIRRLAADPELRARLGEAGARDVRAYTYDAWAEGFSGALASLGLSAAAVRDRGSPHAASTRSACPPPRPGALVALSRSIMRIALPTRALALAVAFLSRCCRSPRSPPLLRRTSAKRSSFAARTANR